MLLLEALRSPGHYALFEAIRYKRHRQALLLTEAGVDVNCRNGRGLTPLIYTATNLDNERSRAKFTRLLLDAGSDPNMTDWDGLTPLMHASRLGQAEVVKPLLECLEVRNVSSCWLARVKKPRVQRVKIQDTREEICIQIGRMLQQQSFIGFSITPDEGLPLTRPKTQQWTNIDLKDPDGNTALLHAAMNGHVNIISAFISHYKQDMASLNLNHKNNQGLTALQIALSHGQEECARLLTRETQFFPSTISEFPDPKVLDRDPTPIEGKLSCPDIQCFSPTKMASRRSSRVPQTSRKSTKNVGVYCNNGFSEVQLDSASLSDDKSREISVESSVMTKMHNRTTQTPSCKTRSKTSKPLTHILEPINGLESVFIHHLSVHTGPRTKDTTDILMQRNTSGYRSNWWGEDGILSGHQGKRPESEPSILPTIPCASPLPPVKKTLHSSPSKRSAHVNSLFNADLPITNADPFQKNVFVHSS